jgi:hypothetical protein
MSKLKTLLFDVIELADHGYTVTEIAALHQLSPEMVEEMIRLYGASEPEGA